MLGGLIAIGFFRLTGQDLSSGQEKTLLFVFGVGALILVVVYLLELRERSRRDRRKE